jgi:hypothetical protein
VRQSVKGRRQDTVVDFDVRECMDGFGLWAWRILPCYGKLGCGGACEVGLVVECGDLNAVYEC